MKKLVKKSDIKRDLKKTEEFLLKRVIPVLLCLLMTAGVLPAAALAASELDYSKGTAAGSMTASQVVEYICGETPGEAEAAYIAAYGNFDFAYSAVNSASGISMDGTETSLKVSVSPVSYRGANGKTVTWTPVSASCDGTDKPLTLSGNTYNAEYTGLKQDVTHNVTVNYTADFEITPSEADGIINFAYYAGSAADAQYKEYQTALDGYADALKAYETYLENMKKYEADYAEYKKKVSELESYYAALQKYSEYQEALAEYNKKLEAYNKYLEDYAAYQKKLDEAGTAQKEYAEKLAAYEKYQKDYEAYKTGTAAGEASLYFFEFGFSSGLYDTINGGIVDMAIGKQDVLLANINNVSDHAQAEASLADAESSTTAIRAMLSDYETLMNGNSRKACFDWYAENYSTLLSEMWSLQGAIDGLFDIGVVRQGLLAYYTKNPSYTESDCASAVEMLAEFILQMYIQCAIMDDTATLNTSTGMSNKHIAKANYVLYGTDKNSCYVTDIIEKYPYAYTEDTNKASPAGINWPEEPAAVEKPTAPGEVITPPAAVEKPEAPAVVEKPAEPASLPVEPTKPAAVSKPSEPKAPVFDAQTQAVYDAVKNETLKKRSLPSAITVITRECSCDTTYTYSPYVPEKYTVTWVTALGTFTAQYEEGQTPSFDGDTSKPADEKATYTFKGWDRQLSAVTADVTYTAQYTATAKKYTVTWVCPKGTTQEEYEYGTLPSFKGDTSKPADAQATYTFKGWDRTVERVTENVTYTAMYSSSGQKYTVTWVVGSKSTKQTYAYGEIPVFSGSTDKAPTASSNYVFIGWDKTLAPVTADITYTARYSEEVRRYRVTWKIDTATVVEEYKYGDVPVFVGDTSKPADSKATYTFTGWDKTPSAVKKDVTYTARYSSTWLIPASDNSGKYKDGLSVDVTASSVAATVPKSVSTIDLTNIAAAALMGGKDIVLSYQGFTVTIPNGKLSELPIDKGITLYGTSSASLSLMSAGKKLSTDFLLIDETGADGANLDYSAVSGTPVTVSIAQADVVKLIIGSEILPAEAEYLATIREYCLKYSTVADSKYVAVTGIGDSITVKASGISYSAVNGVTVSWVPDSACCDGSEPLLLMPDDGFYTCTFTNVNAADNVSVTVTYSAEFVISPSAAYEIINRAYNDAVDAIAEEEEYSRAVADYNTEKEAYDKYLKDYAAYNAAYQAYLTKLSKYELYAEQLAAYSEYLEAKAAYEKKLAEYNSYLEALEAHKASKAAYDAEVAAAASQNAAYKQYLSDYAKYTDTVESVAGCLAVLDSCYITSSAGHQLYATIMGGTVDTVLQSKSQIIEAAGSGAEQYINAAGTSTDVLRKLLTEYKDIKEAGDTKACFEWYVKNYDTVKENFITLYSSLYTLYKLPIVAMAAHSKGRTERMCQFLAHLYILETCLDDTALCDTNSWKLTNNHIASVYYSEHGISGKNTYTLADFKSTDPESWLTDKNASSPAKLSWPTEPAAVEQPVIKTVVTPEPKEVVRPLEPTEVTKPTAPADLAEPEKPAEVKAPDSVPAAPSVSSVLRAVMNAVKDGTLTRRTAPEDDITVQKTTDIFKLVDSTDIGKYPVITFIDYDGTLIKHVQVKDGYIAAADIPSPKLPENNGISTYAFNGWKTTDGKTFDFTFISADATVYPDVTVSAVTYKITWVTASGKTVQTYKYGEIPVFNGSTDKPSDGKAYYTFAGWDTEISPVAGDATYTAQYREEAVYFTVKWILSGKTYEETYAYGETPKCPVDPLSESIAASDTKYYGFTGWDVTPTAVTGNATYTAVYSSSDILPAYDGSGKSLGGIAVSSTASEISAEIPAGTCRLDITYIAAKAVEGGKDVRLSCSGFEIRLPDEMLKNMPYSNGLTLSFTSGGYTGAYFSCSLSLESAGKALSADSVRVSIPAPSGGNFRALASADGKAYTETTSYADGDRLVFKAENGNGSYFALIRTYSVRISAADGGAIYSDKSTAAAGEKVTITATADAGRTLPSVKAGGTAVTDEGNGVYSFIMPESDLTVTGEFGYIEYTVSFYAEGKLILKESYRYGDLLKVPEAPEKAATETEGYTFRGWTPEIERTVTQDASYTAEYEASPFGEIDIHNDTVIPEWVWVAAGLAVAAIAGAAALIIIKKKKQSAAK